MQVEGDYGAKLFWGARSCAAGSVEIGDQAIEGIVLAEEEDFVFAAEIVVEIGGREVGGCGDFAHSGFCVAAGAEFASGGAQDVQPAGEIAALQAGGAHGDRIAPEKGIVNRKVTDFHLMNQRTGRAAESE